ncbi:MAG TPA: TRAP transporter large permease [Ramlibacter sp.]|uniref:TRAP transporter large permease n=1 Tax=Ramlibacter sp. TaxID=1917967 RepID=UPI002C708301|nr:TRAP transporter large permease [Ramlibacter sp.]HVZ42653.1 TRAP transporter large permease [Ramlibacter sp.]
MTATLFLLFPALLVLGVPYAFSLGIASFLLALLGPYSASLIVHRVVIGVDNFLLVAIPMFILAGNVMERGGISGRLIDLARAILCRLRGGLPNSLVLAEMFFSGISGSTVADISAMSSMVVPSMERAGYRRAYALAIVSAASAFGILIPPCILMVVTAALLNSSVIAVFAASALPTAVFAVLTMGLVYWQAARAPAGVAEGPPLGRAAREAAWALGLPVIIVVGIVTGIATATEIAVAAVLYAFAVTLFVYRTLRWRDIPELLLEAASSTGALCLTFGFATILTYVLAREQVPQMISEWCLAAFHSPVPLMLLFSLAFLVLGAILEGLPAALILVPVLWPAAESLGITSLHFQIVIIAAIGIGLFLPPFGLGLIIAAQVGQEPVERITRDFMPFLAVLLVGQAIVAAFPIISNLVPRWLGMQT